MVLSTASVSTVLLIFSWMCSHYSSDVHASAVQHSVVLLQPHELAFSSDALFCSNNIPSSLFRIATVLSRSWDYST
jgi:hypothetical protein